MAAPWDRSVQRGVFNQNAVRNRFDNPNNAGFRPQQRQERPNQTYRAQNSPIGQTPRQQNQQFQHGFPQSNFFRGGNEMQLQQNMNFPPPIENSFSSSPMQQYGMNQKVTSRQEHLNPNKQSDFRYPSQQVISDQNKHQNFQHPGNFQSFANRGKPPGFFSAGQVHTPLFNQSSTTVSMDGTEHYPESVTGPSQVQVSAEDMERKIGEEWLRNWLKQIRAEERTGEHDQSMTLSEAHDKTRHMIVLLAKLQKNKQQLDSMKHENKSVWGQKLNEVQKIKADFEVLHQKLTSPCTVKLLKEKIAKRQSKRRRLKRQKQEEYARQQEELACQQKKHEEMDKYMEQAKQKIEHQKQEETMKKEGDQILSEVKKKISEATKSLQLLTSLQKLRQLRVDRFDRQGVLGQYEGFGAGHSNTQRFNETVTGMIELLNSQLKTYQAEEAALKVILETEHEETREKEREKQIRKEHEQRLREVKKQDRLLFGAQKEAAPGDPLYPFAQYYKAAENSLDALISIRHDWDMHLVMSDTPGASQIPNGWVVPSEPSSAAWKRFLQDNT